MPWRSNWARIYAGVADFDEVEEVLAAYSEALGIAYQIRDDLSDLGAAGETNDIAGLRPSLLLASRTSRRKVKPRSASPPAGRASDADDRRGNRGALSRARHRRTLPRPARALQGDAIRTLRDVENPSLKGLLRRVIGKIFNDTEIKGWCKEFEQKAEADRAA